ncbi:ArsJ-associated glyceraldehyde-3-phosphate dehydrogenase [Nisaea acidiphila]|uniref:Glyceraldehyde-3-phosphate dehydrogenase n=1 Tax=Nisaea acidiphila TaxID=1862145 RepID=A0A9J7AXJ3_9PROT|nr:ArsJ-associated glyceraldehyde-3-phosphate dehydrogenase [Nisaea acidiphila]UUX52008.1 ArsJ-associated glyceraldehyde-3-phosphate dehydrogenase [Nisaea acidiphila]
MNARVAINGFGRMGRMGMRARWGLDDLEIVAINDPAMSPEMAAHLLEFDTVHRRWNREVGWTEQGIVVDGREIPLTAHESPAENPWTGSDVDILLECSGKFKSGAALSPYFERGITKIVVSAPVKEDGALNIVMGVNDHLYDPAQHHLVTAASCTTNCLAPVVKVVHEGIGIRHGAITTIHDVTNTQVIVDGPHKDLRRARSALNALIPTSTGSATAIGLIYPELQGRLNGHAVRVPLLNASLTDCVFELERETSTAELNELFVAAAASGPLEGILGFESRPLVSTDFTDDPRSAIVDGPSTMVVNGTQAKIYAWYDNEWGYVNRMMELTAKVAASL